jgi:DNA adenine modification methylase
MPRINNLDLENWKDLSEITTDSLWIIDKRYNENGHRNGFWGNFVPQIPYQFIQRYTKIGDLVLDPFSGGGTTLIEARRLGRDALGFEINTQTCQTTQQILNDAEKFLKNDIMARAYLACGDSLSIDYSKELQKIGRKKAQLVILHPPYWNIIKFGQETNNLCNTETLDAFLEKFQIIVRKSVNVLEKGRYLAIVIADKYENGELIPLGFYTMQAAQKEKLKLKSIIVKNFDTTKGKQNQQALWRYRALANGLYLFKHEYIFLFKK